MPTKVVSLDLQKDGWSSTGINLLANTVVTVTAAGSGTWNGSSDANPWGSSYGYPGNPTLLAAKARIPFSLVMAVAGAQPSYYHSPSVQGGNSFTFNSGDGGPLWMAFNDDHAAYGDNTGAFILTIDYEGADEAPDACVIQPPAYVDLDDDGWVDLGVVPSGYSLRFRGYGKGSLPGGGYAYPEGYYPEDRFDPYHPEVLAEAGEMADETETDWVSTGVRPNSLVAILLPAAATPPASGTTIGYGFNVNRTPTVVPGAGGLRLWVRFNRQWIPPLGFGAYSGRMQVEYAYCPPVTIPPEPPVDVELGPRYVPPMKWIPRWAVPHYDEGSTMRGWYVSTFPRTFQEFREIVAGTRSVSFYGDVSQPRLSYTARLNGVTSTIPKIELVSAWAAVATGEIAQADSQGSFLFESIRPIAYMDGDLLLFRNLALVEYEVATASGYIHLGTEFAADPPVPDTHFVVISPWGDVERLDAEDARIEGDRIRMDVAQRYRVRWLSQSVHDSISGGSTYIKVGGARIDVTPDDLRNAWDEYGWIYGLRRRNGQSNLSLKIRCQMASLASGPVQRIAAALGLANVAYWSSEASGVFPLPADTVEAGVFGLPRTSIVDEVLTKDGEAFLTSRVPAGRVQLFHRGQPVMDDLSDLSETLKRAADGDVRGRYEIESYVEDESSLTKESMAPGTRLVVLARGVRLRKDPLRELKWKWNEEKGRATGLAEFD